MKTRKQTVSINRAARNWTIALAFVALLAQPCSTALGQSTGQDTYDSLDAAVEAFKGAFGTPVSSVPGPRTRIFGTEFTSFSSGEAAQDNAELAKLDKAVKEVVRPVMINPKHAVLFIGALNWPFPIPVIQNAAGKWFFDTAAGREEYLNRRIGRNELSTMETLRTCARAQVEYAAEDRDGDGVLEYAQKYLSTDGTKDGLYWPSSAGESMSPIGALIAGAMDEGYVAGQKSYHGYRYAILTSQGAAAAGGAKDFLVDGNMVRGFALLAYPVSWGSSGVMTFVVGPDGRVFERNLGPSTPEAAAAITTYNPDASWKLSDD